MAFVEGLRPALKGVVATAVVLCVTSNRLSATDGAHGDNTTQTTVAGKAAKFTLTGGDTARYDHTATLLTNGKVLAAGGYNSSSLTTSSLYDASTGHWQLSAGQLQSAHSGHTATLLPNGKVLVAGGGTSTAEIYNPTTQIWTATGPLQSSRYRHTATLLGNGKVLVVGGGITATAELYNPATGSWSLTGSLATDRDNQTATLLPSGKVLVAGGYDAVGGVSTKSCDIYDPATGTWTATGSLVSGRDTHTATLLTNGKVLVAGGTYVGAGGGYSSLDSAELYAPSTGTWTSTGSLPTWRWSHTATRLANGKVLLAGGNASHPQEADLYDPVTGTWSPTANMLEFGRADAAATLLPDGRVLVTGGEYAGSAHVTCELYNPGWNQPVVFVPGIMGTTLVDSSTNAELWPGSVTTNHKLLSLFPSDNPSPSIQAADVTRVVSILGTSTPVYQPLLDHLAGLGYIEYQVAGLPSRRTTAGCDVTGQSASRPDLFVFGYDWRKDNADNAAALADYIGCVELLHPGEDLVVIAHSMGGLLSRRYILDHPGSPHVRTLISIGTPWLGAPKTLDSLEYGNAVSLLFNSLVMRWSTAKYVLGSFAGAFELLPSAAYQTLYGGAFLSEKGWDLDGDGQPKESDSFADYRSLVDARYGLSASGADHLHGGTLTDQFHSYGASQGKQDDGRTDTTGVQYCQFVGITKSPRTIGSVTASGSATCEPVGGGHCIPLAGFAYEWVSGDGTVPRISAERRGSGQDYNPPGTEVLFPDPGKGSVEHTDLAAHPDVFAKFDALLSAGALATAIPSVPPAPAPALYVTLANVGTIVVKDAQGHSSEPFPGAPETQGAVPGAAIFRTANGSYSVVLDLGTVFTIDFTSPSGPVLLDVQTGLPGAITSLLRYADLQLPVGKPIRLSFGAAGFTDVRYDGDVNGTYESVVSPSVTASDPAAVDTAPPILTVSRGSLQGTSCLVTAAASDALSGVKRILVSVDGSSFTPYASPFAVDVLQHRKVWAIADDNLDNRAATELLLVPGGDVNGDGAVSALDVFYLINHLFAAGPAPIDPGDVNGDDALDVLDVFYLINYLFAGGPRPIG